MDIRKEMCDALFGWGSGNALGKLMAITADLLERMLVRYKKRTIDRENLRRWGKCSSEKELYELVEELKARGAIRPFKTKGKTNGNPIYPVMDKYHILVKDDYSDVDEQIRNLHPVLLRNGYLNRHKEKFREYGRRLEQVSDYLYKVKERSGSECYSSPISKKSRSYLIFGEEKVFDEEKGFLSLLGSLGVGSDLLMYYETPPYAYPTYVHRATEHPVYIITENKDIWFDLRRLMFEDNIASFLGCPLDGVVLGYGNQITKKGGALTEYTKFLKVDARYLYCGDIDRAGFRIYKWLCEENPGLKIDLFLPAYRLMLDLAEGVEFIERSRDERKYSGPPKDILALFECDRHKALLVKCLDENRRIPQEILNYYVMRQYSEVQEREERK